MKFCDITEQIVNGISERTRFSNMEVSTVLMKSRDANRPDFYMFLNQISSDPIADAASLGEAIKDIDIIENIVVKNTVVSFNLKKNLFLAGMITSILEAGCKFGSSTNGVGKRAVVDFSSPNIAKIFHVGHFRTTVLGNFVVNLLRTGGYDVLAMNYLGDWGKQFGLVLLGYERFGDKELLKKDPLIHLFNIYVKISAEAKTDDSVNQQAREIFRSMEEDKNEKYLSQWRMFRELSIEKYKTLYKKLNIEFDVYSGESLYNEAARDFASQTSICKQDEDGSYVIDGGKTGKILVQKLDGTTLYMTRDIVAAKDRIENYKADYLYYVVGDEQSKHFEQLFTCMEMLGYDRSRFRHINYGLIKGMSTRNGQVHFLEDVITNSAAVIKEKLLTDDKGIEDKDSTALILAVSTLLIADFGAKRIKGYTFDIEQRANCEAGSGAYLQYAHCRLLSIEAKNAGLSTCSVDFSLVDSPEVCAFAYKLFWYEHIIELCFEDFEPSRIVVYLMDLVKSSNNLVNKLRVMNTEENLASARLAILKAARIVIGNGLRVLGIQPLERM
ncbi:arginyl-tRNA synthetase [Pancytospora epiphaga]|nr:arginyl-tRNA synthetase [Pancytospora epiphaga]